MGFKTYGTYVDEELTPLYFTRCRALA